MFLAPVVEKRLQAWQALSVLGAIRRLFACDDIYWMADRESLDIHSSLPGSLERFNPIRGEHKIKIEGAILELDEVLTPLDLQTLDVGQLETELDEGGNNRLAVDGRLLHEEVSILRGVRVAEQDRSGLAEEQVPYIVARERVTISSAWAYSNLLAIT